MRLTYDKGYPDTAPQPTGITASAGPLTNTGIYTVLRCPSDSNQRLDLSYILITNSDNDIGTVVTIKDGDRIVIKGFAAPQGGFVVPLSEPLPLHKNLTVQMQTAVDALYVSMSGRLVNLS